MGNDLYEKTIQINYTLTKADEKRGDGKAVTKKILYIRKLHDCKVGVGTEDRFCYYWNVKQGRWIRLRHGLHEVLRVFSKTLLGYSHAELPNLAEVQAAAKEAGVDLYIADEEGEAPAYFLQMCWRMLNRIGNVRDEDKVAAKKGVWDCLLYYKDSTGRIRVGYLKETNQRIRRRIQARIKTIHRIEPRLVHHSMCVRNAIGTLEKVITDAVDDLRDCYQMVLKSGGHLPKTSGSYRRVLGHLRQIKADTEMLCTVRPYDRTGDRVRIELRQAREILDNMSIRNNNGAQAPLLNLLTKIGNALKLRLNRGFLENTLQDLTVGTYMPEHFNTSMREDLAEKLKEQVRLLSTTNEAGFENPVIWMADGPMISLTSAIGILIRNEPLTKDDIQRVREMVKKALVPL